MQFRCLPDAAGTDGILAELAEQPGKMVNISNLSQPNPSLQADGTPCTYCIEIVFILT